MNANKYKPHVLLIPEDEANNELINGFLDHPQVNYRAVTVRGPAGGWSYVLSLFQEEAVPHMKSYKESHVVMLIDFDNDEGRRAHFEAKIPEGLRDRVFLIGSKKNPEALRKALGMSLETVGKTLAEECCCGKWDRWHSPHIEVGSDATELTRMAAALRPILF